MPISCSYKQTKTKDTVSAFYRESSSLLPHLGSKPHLVILPRVELDFHWQDDSPSGPGLTSQVYANISQHFTFLTIEIDQWVWGDLKVRTAF